MSTPLNALLTGTFVSDGSIVNLSLPSDVQEFRLVNTSDVGSAAAATPVMIAEWALGMADGSAVFVEKTNGAATLQAWNSTASNGFTRIPDSGNQSPGAAVSITAITNANPAVVSTASTTGLATNTGVVRIINSTAMLQIASMDFSVGTVVLNTSFGLRYLDASGFAAAATGGSYRIIPFDPRFYPVRRFITAITQAASAVITMSVAHGFTVGQAVRVICPAAFGMVEIDGLIGNITAISTGATNTITVDIDSSAFSAFAFPTSATAAGGVTFAQVVPVGEEADGSVANNLDDATDNISFRGIRIGTTVQDSGSTYRWFARRGVQI